MKRTAVIERRIAALESVYMDTTQRTIVVFRDPDGTVRRDAIVYPDIDAAQAANPGYNTWVIVQVEDMSKP
ncbi:MAG: hypothetical protein AB7U59_17200 [Desulfovibrionaceae bacterium]